MLTLKSHEDGKKKKKTNHSEISFLFMLSRSQSVVMVAVGDGHSMRNGGDGEKGDS